MAVALAAFGIAGAWRPREAALATAAACAVGALGAIGFLIDGARAAPVGVPLGLPGAGITLALDGLSGFFLLPVLLVGLAVSAATAEAACWVGPLLGAALLALLAGDGRALVLGIAAMAALALAASAFGGADPVGCRAARRAWGGTALAVLALAAALALLVPAASDAGFAAMRAHPPNGGGVALLPGLALLLLVLPPPQGGAAAPVGAVLQGGWRLLSAYLAVRLLFDLAGPVQPVAWGVPLLALGAAVSVAWAWRALAVDDLRRVAEAGAASQFGLVAAALGVALAVRAEDLGPLAALALGGALVTSVAQALTAALLLLVAGVVEREAATRRLARLGGLARGMPLAALAVFGGGLTLAALPPGGGFAGLWLILQSLLAALRLGFLPLQMLLALATGAMAAAVALLAAAVVRLIGVAFLGRPRTPRAAGALEPPRPMRAALLALAGGGLAVGLFPGAVLALARPALLLAVGEDMAGRAGVLAVAAQDDAPGYAAPAAALLLGLGAALTWGIGRRWAVRGQRPAPAWDNGFGAPPPWLPFGDPSTQIGAAGFAGALRAEFGEAARIAPAPPGEPLPGRIFPGGRARHVAALLRAGRAVGRWAASLDDLPPRPALALALALLVLLLTGFGIAGRAGW